MTKASDGLYDPTRRDFFRLIALASMAFTVPPLAGCKAKSAFTGTGEAPYKIWEELLFYLQSSPDHLRGRMERLIEQGDPEAMFLFVRDEIYLMPQNKKSIGYGEAYKWGLDYVLRSGMATMREKAELLHQMYQKAGIPSEVKIERTNISPEEAQSFFFRPIERSFSPEISKGMLRRWATEMGMQGAEYHPAISLEEEEEQAIALAEKIWDSLELSEDFYYPGFDFRWPNYKTPVVEFQWEDAPKYAHLFDPNVPFGTLRSGEATNVSKAVEIMPNTEEVSITISYRDSITPPKEKELIAGVWPAADLVGRQLDVLFLNNLTLEEMAVVPVRNVSTFTPALALQAIGATPEYMEQRTILGDPIQLSGKRIKLNTAGNVIQVGDALINSNPNPDLRAQVESITLSASTMGYPGVKLSLSPTDANGQIVEGLSSSDFMITEDGKPVRALMGSNQRTPRILILSDGSASMPSAYYQAGMDAFVEALKGRIVDKYPAAIIKHWITPSSLFTWLLKASQTENDLIVFATDGHNDDTFNPKNEAIYRNGPPAIILNVYDRDSGYTVKTFEKMAELTGGTHLLASDQAKSLESIDQYLENIEIQPYTFTYYSAGGLEERTVKVNLSDEKIADTATYRFEATSSADHIGPRIIGVYLEVKYGTQYAVKRVLAGWDYLANPNEQPAQTMADEVNDLMLGNMQLYFEGAGPTFSAALSDLLQAKLSTREWGEAILRDDPEKAKAAFKKGQLSISGEALALMAPLQAPATDRSFTMPGGLRIGLQTLKPGFITGKTVTLFDYLPTSEYTTLAKDPSEAFRINLQKTAQLAIRENKLFQNSTLSELADKTWINLKNARAENWFYEHRSINDRYWGERVNRGAQLRIFDRSASSRAFWDIIPTTGEVYGMLANGSGGGGSSGDNEIDKLAAFYTALLSLLEIMQHYKLLAINPIGGLALSVVAKYGETLVRLYAIVSEAIMIMDASGVDDQVKAALQQFACNVAKEVVYATTGNMGKIMGGLDNLIGLIAPENNPFPCN